MIILYDMVTMVTRPWGSYEVLSRGEKFLSKKITVLPSQRLSLQSHEHRSEHWVVVSGEGEITLGKDVLQCSCNTSAFIPCGVKHRIRNISASRELIFVEVQIGDVLEESDIIRYEDDYDRKTVTN